MIFHCISSLDCCCYCIHSFADGLSSSLAVEEGPLFYVQVVFVTLLLNTSVCVEMCPGMMSVAGSGNPRVGTVPGPPRPGCPVWGFQSPAGK